MAWGGRRQPRPWRLVGARLGRRYGTQGSTGRGAKGRGAYREPHPGVARLWNRWEVARDVGVAVAMFGGVRRAAWAVSGRRGFARAGVVSPGYGQRRVV